MLVNDQTLKAPARFYSPTGQFYMPSYPWAVDCFARMSDGTHHIASDAATLKSHALEKAQAWVLGHPERSAEVRRRRDNRLMMHYWFDSVGLQYVTFLRP